MSLGTITIVKSLSSSELVEADEGVGEGLRDEVEPGVGGGLGLGGGGLGLGGGGLGLGGGGEGGLGGSGGGDVEVEDCPVNKKTFIVKYMYRIDRKAKKIYW